MKKRLTKSDGFTLIEILIATAIFAMVMIIVIATFTWAAGYNNRLKEMRRVSQEVRLAMDDLTKNVRLANGSGKWGSTNIGEITLFNCSGSLTSTCTLVAQGSAVRYKSDLTSADPSADTPVSNALLVLQQNNNKAILYRQILVSTGNYKLNKAEQNISSWPASIDLSTINTLAQSLNPEDKTSMQVWFGGFGPNKTSRTQQPYAEIYLIGKTYNYDTVAPNMRSKFHLRTMVESRDYN